MTPIMQRPMQTKIESRSVLRTAMRTVSGTVILAGTLMSAVACNDLSGLAGSQPLPSGTPDPSSFHNEAGALAMYQAALYTFQYSRNGATSIGGSSALPGGADGAFVDYVLSSGLLTDELQAGNLGGTPVSYLGVAASETDSTDARQLIEGGNNYAIYSGLQNVRGSVSQALGALTQYAPSSSPALRGQLYAVRGYAELLLADLFCSGVPLSTLDYNGDFTYQPGSTTAQLYQHAVAQFDTALTLSTDSERVMNLARVGRGRALLDLQQDADAAQAVASVPDDFQYQFFVAWNDGSNGLSIFSSFGISNDRVGVTVADAEGGHGLPYVSGGDPRSASQRASNNQYGRAQYVPVKYGGASPGVFPITVADGIEARLIEAEVALRAHDYTTWLDKLNRARTLAAPSLPALTDPGSDTARVSLLFQERAYDLFLSGRRQGDLRRLVRQYGRQQNTVYPTGSYSGIMPSYGSAVTVPIPSSEHVNPLYSGCIDRNA